MIEIFWFVSCVLAGFTLYYWFNDDSEEAGVTLGFLIFWCLIALIIRALPIGDSWEEKATAYEISFMNVLVKGNSCIKYTNTYSAIEARIYTPNSSSIPFKDIYESIRLDEVKTCNSRNITATEVLMRTKGITLEQLVGEKPLDTDTKEIPKETAPVEVQPIEVVKSSLGDDILSPALYKEVVSAVKSCKRAKIKLLDITEEKPYLTKDDYGQVMGAVLKCEALKLEVELNK